MVSAPLIQTLKSQKKFGYKMTTYVYITENYDLIILRPSLKLTNYNLYRHHIYICS